MPEIAGKRVLVTGACGTVGAELVRQLRAREQNAPEEAIRLDNNESDLFFLDQECVADPRARFFVADIRDRDELARRMQGVDLVFHAAADKLAAADFQPMTMEEIQQEVNAVRAQRKPGAPGS